MSGIGSKHEATLAGNKRRRTPATDRQRTMLAHPAGLRKTKEEREAERPEWMADPSKLPKRPPGKP